MGKNCLHVYYRFRFRMGRAGFDEVQAGFNRVPQNSIGISAGFQLGSLEFNTGFNRVLTATAAAAASGENAGTCCLSLAPERGSISACGSDAPAWLAASAAAAATSRQGVAGASAPCAIGYGRRERRAHHGWVSIGLQQRPYTIR